MLDRTVDLVSPFLTQKTYEGAIDEQYSLCYNHCRVSGVSNIEAKTYKLDNTDAIFKEIRHEPYEALGFYFKQKST